MEKDMSTGSKSGSGVDDQEQKTRGLKHWDQWSREVIQRLRDEKDRERRRE